MSNGYGDGCPFCKVRESHLHELEAAVERLTAERDDLICKLEEARAHANSKVGDTVTEGLWDSLWGIVHPGQTDWDYPAQVYRHVRDYVLVLKAIIRLKDWDMS